MRCRGLPVQLHAIQSRLLDAGSAIATPPSSSKASKVARTAFDPDAAAQLEGWIDAMDTELPRLTGFILPSGGTTAAALHVARSVARRAERTVTPLARDGATDASVAVFLNRLSDYLFTAARRAAARSGEKETLWRDVRVGSAAQGGAPEP